MSHKIRGLKVLGLSLLAVAGLMALMASSASALWLENTNGKNLEAITANKEVKASTHTEGKLFVEKETNLEILCSTIAANDLLLVNGTTEATGKVNFSTCKTWQGGKDISANCTPVTPIEASGKAKLILHNSENWVLFEPTVAGGNFATIKFVSPCALPSSNFVKGTLVAECTKLEAGALKHKDCATGEKPLHLLQPNEALFTGDTLTYGTKPATLKGVANVELASGNEWAGHV